MNGVIGAIGSQPLGFPFRARRPKEVIFLCKATVVEQSLKLFQFIRFGGCVQPVSRVPRQGDDKSKTILEIEFPCILKSQEFSSAEFAATQGRASATRASRLFWPNAVRRNSLGCFLGVCERRYLNPG